MTDDSYARRRCLEIEEDMRFQQRNWRAERIGWALIALVVIAALLGLFAEGPLGSTTVRSADGALGVEYDRIQRHAAPARLRVDISADAIGSDGVTIVVDETFARIFDLKNIQPAPADSAAAASGMRFRFLVEPGASARIYFRLDPDEIGLSRPKLGLTGRSPLELPVLIYP